MAKGGRWSDGELVEVRDMRDAETTLAIIRERGKAGLMADLKVKGRGAIPAWKQVMIARRRKTLMVCHHCHTAIHAGRPTRTRESQDVQFMDNRPLESRVL